MNNTINNDNYDEFKRECEAAISLGQSTFTFEGNVIVTGYAKYLIQYAEGSE